MAETWTVETAHISHGRDGWQVHVEQVSLWRLLASKVVAELVHASGLCCGWGSQLPGLLGDWAWQAGKLAYRIDNGWWHVQYRLDVSDDWARTHVPDFWAVVQRWDNEDQDEDQDQQGG